MTDSSDLLAILEDAVASALGEARDVAVAYSGGLDSALIARLAKERATAKCYTCAMKGSFDAAHAQDFAEHDGLGSKLIEVETAALPGLVGRTSRALNTEDPSRVAYSIPLACVVELCHERTILSGCGADEVFGGYGKYLRTPDPSEMMRSDLAKMLAEDDGMARFAKGLGKRYHSPFVTESVLSFSDRLPISRKVSGGERKVVLREVAFSLGLESHDRPKKAAQYSTGILKEMKNQAKQSGLDLATWVRDQAWDVVNPRHVNGQRN